MAKSTDIFPLLNPDCKNGIFEPLPHWDKDSWQNKNRKPRTKEELLALYNQYCPFKNIEVLKHEVLLFQYPRIQKDSKLIKIDRFIPQTAFIGKIIKMGEEVFDILTFKKGAPATYNDWVTYDIFHSEERYLFSNVFVKVRDTDIKMMIEKPMDFNFL